MNHRVFAMSNFVVTNWACPIHVQRLCTWGIPNQSNKIQTFFTYASSDSLRRSHAVWDRNSSEVEQLREREEAVLRCYRRRRRRRRRRSTCESRRPVALTPQDQLIGRHTKAHALLWPIYIVLSGCGNPLLCFPGRREWRRTMFTWCASARSHVEQTHELSTIG